MPPSQIKSARGVWSPRNRLSRCGLVEIPAGRMLDLGLEADFHAVATRGSATQYAGVRAGLVLKLERSP